MPRLTVARAFGITAVGLAAGIFGSSVSAQGVVTNHRVSSAMAGELLTGAVGACKEQGYNVTTTLVDIDV
jgi:hypothetical protein